MRTARALPTLFVAAATLGCPEVARAQVVCPTSSGESLFLAAPTVADGSVAPMQLAQLLVNLAVPASATVYSVDVAACQAIQSLMTRAPLPQLANQLNPFAASTACVSPALPPDIVLSDVSPDTCAATQGIPTPAMLGTGRSALKDFWGPIATTAFVVPTASKELSISADAAYVVFGFAAPVPGVSPWTAPAGILAPNRQSALLDLVGQGIGLAPANWATAAHSKVTPISTALMTFQGATSMTAPGMIGVLPGATAEANPDTVRILAYEHTGQQCGYLPSSDASHFDHINVRQGRYALWTPVHVLMAVDILGNVVDHTGAPNSVLARIAATLVATGPAQAATAGLDASAGMDAMAMDATTSGDGGGGGALDAGALPSVQTIVQNEIVAGLIPWCAMQVTRASDLGAEASYQPPLPCGCYYENLTGAATSQCLACRVNTDCSRSLPVCRYGFCEAQ